MESDPNPSGSIWRSYDTDIKTSSTGFGHIFTDQPVPEIHHIGMWEPQETQEKNRFIDDADWFQPPRESSILVQSYGKFSPPCYHQEDQDWSFDTQYPLDVGEQQGEEEIQDEMVGIRTAAGTGTPTSLLSDNKTQPNTPESITAPPNSPEYVSTIPTPAVTPFKSGTPSFTAAAHQAVVDLFPEIVDTCIFRVKPTLPESETQNISSIIQAYPTEESHETYHSLPFSNPRASKRKRNSDMCSRFNQTPSSIPFVPIESPDIEDPQRRDKLSISPHPTATQPSFAATYTVDAYEPLKSGHLSQLSSDLVNLDLKNSEFSHVFGIPEETPSPNITISPRHLSKLKLPSTPPPKSVFDPEGLEKYHDFSRFISDQELIDSDEATMSDNDIPSPSPASTPTSFISRPLPDSKELLREQNRLLLRWRSEGISYRTIKKKLGINEAESTLRGRLRTLTKPKSERLRKPQWTEEDIELLLEIVDPSILGVKWKQVSDTIRVGQAPYWEN
ncbi:uncharacterized protein H6S33_009447 [Morchella sextelata]|uniref:uncharacterized protein n=1 Tax=Morchella sextelata TaxID=1174677 RepID=UPI001D03BFC4|nr:uncharacterized protein H6S33_009447 [Morchella sextelata]KAH0613067.1 hypothetical protein H6S33_009447 [Morchella sextelata]